MRKESLLIVLIVSMLSINVFSKALDRPDNANHVFKLIFHRMMKEPGMNGMDVTGCDPATGKKIDLKYDFIHCVRIYGSSKNAVENLLSIYPVGTRIRNVPIVVEFAQWQVGG